VILHGRFAQPHLIGDLLVHQPAVHGFHDPRLRRGEWFAQAISLGRQEPGFPGKQALQRSRQFLHAGRLGNEPRRAAGLRGQHRIAVVGGRNDRHHQVRRLGFQAEQAGNAVAVGQLEIEQDQRVLRVCRDGPPCLGQCFELRDGHLRVDLADRCRQRLAEQGMVVHQQHAQARFGGRLAKGQGIMLHACSVMRRRGA
jgi:hypothetical protein